MKTLFSFILMIASLMLDLSVNWGVALAGSLEETKETVSWKEVYKKIYISNIIKEGLSKIDSGDFKSEDEIQNWIHKSVYYSELPASRVYNKIIGHSSAEEMADAREKYLGVRVEIPHIEANAKKSIYKYFQTPSGRMVLSALHDHIMIIIPGFGSHTMKEYSFPEIVEEANLHYGRPLLRPSKPADYDSDKLVYQSPAEFYSNSSSQHELLFDVLHPMGEELGNSMGKTDDVADRLADWIRALPPDYQGKKIILVGYSKGAPTALHLIQRHSDLRERVKMVVTLAGAVQGAIAAEDGYNNLEKVIKKYTPDLFDFNRENLLAALVGVMGADVVSILKNTKNFFESEDKLIALEGIKDLTQYESVKWSFENLNTQNLGDDLAIFNLSVLTDRSDFLTYNGLTPYGIDRAPSIAPQILARGLNINWKEFSNDNTFLYLSSLGGFKKAPGGLFDTQVAWLDTKSLPLDERPLWHSLDENNLRKLYGELTQKKLLKTSYGRTLSYHEFKTFPRNQLVAKENYGTIKFIDLGDLRGTHWDFAFRQVFVPKDEPAHFRHEFPRKAFLTALAETLAIYNLNQGQLK